MKIPARRSCAAFSAVAAITAGTLLAVTHDASAADRPSAHGTVTTHGAAPQGPAFWNHGRATAGQAVTR